MPVETVVTRSGAMVGAVEKSGAAAAAEAKAVVVVVVALVPVVHVMNCH